MEPPTRVKSKTGCPAIGAGGEKRDNDAARPKTAEPKKKQPGDRAFIRPAARSGSGSVPAVTRYFYRSGQSPLTKPGKMSQPLALLSRPNASSPLGGRTLTAL
jgi:hypothetical protein